MKKKHLKLYMKAFHEIQAYIMLMRCRCALGETGFITNNCSKCEMQTRAFRMEREINYEINRDTRHIRQDD